MATLLAAVRMRSLGAIAAGLVCLVDFAAAAPPPPPGPGPPSKMSTCQGRGATSGTDPGRASSAPSAPSPSSAPTGRTDCGRGGRCDCTGIADKNSEEYFQCVTDPGCEKCWAGASTGVSTSTSTGGGAASPSSPAPDDGNASPWTYTVTASNVVSVIVVPVPPGRTRGPATPSPTPRVITVVETTVVTVAATPLPTTAPAESAPAPVSSAEGARATGPQDGAKCLGVCDCARIQDKKGVEYLQCLTNPVCEDCRSHASALLSKSPSVPASVSLSPPTSRPRPGSSSASTAATTTTTSPAKPKPSCPGYCDCSKIKDKQSNEYFQCVTNPSCERCRGGRRVV